MNTLEDFVQSVIDSLVNPKPTTVPVGPNFKQGKVTVPIIQPPAGSTGPALAVVKPAAAPLILPTLAPVGKWTAATMTAEILRNEGGYVNDPSDSGGATNYGITVGFMNSQKAFFGITGTATSKDVQALSPLVATKAYLTFFFAAGHFDLVPNQSNIVMQLYDMAVNTGVRYADGKSPASEILQQALNVSPVDGVIGASTVAAVNAAIAKSGADFVNNNLVQARCTYYGKIVAAHPQDQKFFGGWKTRANKYKV